MKNKQKGFSAALLIIIIAAVLIIGGIYLYQSSHKPAPSPLTTTASSTAVTNQVVTTTVSPAHPITPPNSPGGPITGNGISSSSSTTGTPFVKILTPSGGEVWGMSQDNEVQWNTNVSGSGSIYLQFADGTTCKVGATGMGSIQPAGLQTFYVQPSGAGCAGNPSKLITPGEYKILIIISKPGETNAVLGTAYDISNSFSISSSSVVSAGSSGPITITYPSAGTVIKIGSTAAIGWKGNTSDTPYSVYLVGGSSLYIGQVSAGQDSIQFPVPSYIKPGSGYRIEVIGKSGVASYGSSFSISE